MSGPFRFQQEEARSPLDRSASPFSAGQPVSFKTNVNRAKTKKWVQAKKNAYDGDDWGGYDEYDEYGVNQEAQESDPLAQRYYAQRIEQPSRSFTDPSQQAPLSRGRRNSFEHGEEQRAFSSTIPYPQQGYGQQYGQPPQQGSGNGYDDHYDMEDRRDFSSSAMPPPLQTRISQVPADFTSPSNTQFPPRKSSIGQGDSPIAMSPRPRTGSQSDKPLPFIRPADIYKRHQEHWERASLDSSRPSLDSLQREDVASAQMEGARSLQPMETVAERRSGYMPDFNAAAPLGDKQLPQQDGSAVARPDDEGLRSVVDQAFTRTDEQRSVPPTPISNDSESDLLRSNTGSTSGISPIMSRVPSSATSALKSRNQAEGSTPAIAEEPSEAATPVSQPTSATVIEAMHHVPRKPSPGHSRNFSSSSTPRSGLATPTRGDSPARSPVLTPQRDIPEPKSALFTTESNEATENMEGGLQGPSAAYATREADIAAAAKDGSGSGAHELGAAERQSQNHFLESHNAQSPMEDVLPHDRSESPSKGRVQALAGKFGEVASSRRGSTQSNLSRNSVQSWERSHDNSRAASPTKASPIRGSSPVKEFRPHLPGQWESYATTAMTPSDQGEQDRGLSLTTNDPTPLDQFDLTPTTAKRPVDEVPASEADSHNPLAALRDAGAAMVHSIRTTVGLDDSSSELSQEQNGRANHGNIYLPRPLQLDRTTTSTSSAPPTPPAKDTPDSEFPPPPPLKERAPQPFKSQPKRPSLDPQLSTDPSAEDQESDRLRKEIVASLAPFKSPDSTANETNRTSHQPASPDANRASSILPSEYDTYWADEDSVTPQPSQEAQRDIQGESSAATLSFLPQSDEPTKPIILNRISWEASKSQLQTPGEQPQAVPDAEPIKASDEDRTASPLVERAAEEERQQWSERLPDSYFGPGHTLTVTKLDPVQDGNMGASSPNPALDPRSVATPSREHTRSPGLHVVNTELDPEAVDLPPRFSAEHQQGPTLTTELDGTEKPAELRQQDPVPISPIEDPKTPIAEDLVAKSPTTDKPLGAREIATLGSTSERITTYNQTREYWATTDHGLGDWLTSTLQANPDLATQPFPTQRPPTGSIRHRHTGSLALFGKLGGSSSHDQAAEQPNSAPVPISAVSPTTGAPSASGFGGRIANQQMQLKGKDLLHTANVLSGKGMTSAKGLFAKGKSRFGRDKASGHNRTDSAPSSREASEEPELVMRRSRASTRWSATPEQQTPEKQLMRSVTEKEKEMPSEEKKRRRFSFSSQLRRVSRSRSRPSSIALPSATPPSVFGATPKSTPPRELHQFLMGERRPNSFHAPDSWSEVPPPALNQYFGTSPRRNSQPRLGILPSPAKSDFLAQEREEEREYVPPVPPIPDDVAIKHYRRRSSQDSNTHRVLQSVIRHSTPPVVPSRHDTPSTGFKAPKTLAHSPVFANDDNAEAGAQEKADDYKVLLSTPKGSFQPDMPTAESQDARNSGFQFGFGDGTATRPKHEDDEDDLPPQLNHDPVPAASPSYQSSPFMSGNKHMDVSDNDSDSNPSKADGTFSLLAPRSGPSINDVSPELPPVQLSQVVTPQNAKVVSVGDTPFVLARHQTNDFASQHEQHLSAVNDLQRSRPVGASHTSDEQGLSAYETEVVGAGDVSPVSSGSRKLEIVETSIKAEKLDAERAFSPVWFTKSSLQLPKSSVESPIDPDEGSRSLDNEPFIGHNADAHISHIPVSLAIGEIARSNKQPKATRAGEASLSLDHAGGANADTDTQSRRVSASSFEAVNDVQIYSASNPSRASWSHDNFAARPRVDAREPDEMRDESDLNAQQAQIPRITHDGPLTPKAEELHNYDTHNTIPNGYTRNHGNFPDFKNQAQQLQASNAAVTVPERSRSMLSQISAMVSDEGSHPYSPTSTGRSTPSTIRRMQPDSSMRTSGTPARIPEETSTAWNDRTPTREEDDFDLYADHNGIVKDVRDESGQPLRLADTPVPGTTQQPQPIKPAAPDSMVVPGSRDGERPRLSEERPMSFVSGPADQDGKPQDQINQAASPLHDMRVPPNTNQHRNQAQQQGRPPMGTVYSANPPTRIEVKQPEQQYHPTPASTLPKNILQAVKSINPSNMAKDTSATFPQTAETTPHQRYYEGSSASNGVSQNASTSKPEPHDLHSLGMGLGQRVPQNAPFLPQTTIPSHDSQSQNYDRAPRNQHKFHQQMPPQGVDSQFPTGSPLSQDQHVQKPQEKSSSKPRLSSVFKSFGAKAQQNVQEQSSMTSTTVKPDFKGRPAPHPAVGRPSVSGEVSLGRPTPQAGSFVPPNRPSRFGENNQDSNRLQSTDLHIDSRKPLTPASYQGFPPQQPPPVPGGQPQPSSVSPPPVLESGKKKRFSALGALFGRSGAIGDGTKPKLSKDEKKAQKAKPSSAVSPSNPHASNWPPRQQHHIPQQSGLAYYPPGQLPPHTVQGVRPIGPQNASPQMLSHLGPQNATGMYPQRPPQQNQQPPSGQSRQSMSGTRPEQGSAFLRTKQLAEEHQARQNSVQAPSVGPGTDAGIPSSTSFSHHAPHLRQTNFGPPPGGFLKPDAKQFSADHGAYTATTAARQEAEQQKRQQQFRGQGAYAATQAVRSRMPPQRQQSEADQGVHPDPRFEQPQMQQQASQPSSEQLAYQAMLAQRQQIQQQQLAFRRDEAPLGNDLQAQQQHQRQPQVQQPQQHAGNGPPLIAYRSVSGQSPHPSYQEDALTPRPIVSSPMVEPRYEAPPIPAAYSHVSGAFISPLDRHQQPLFPSQHIQTVHPAQFNRQDSNPRMQSISPQISAQSQAPPNSRSYSDASTIPVVSPISQSPDIPTSSPPPGGQRIQKPRMSSISEVHQQERPWHMNVPQSATEQEIVRARQKQFMQEHFTAQQKSQAERAARSPSPHASPEETTPTGVAPLTQVQGGGYRELLPRSTAERYSSTPSAQSVQDDPLTFRRKTPVQPTPIHPGMAPHPSAYPLPMSPDSANITSPVNPMASMFPPPPPPKIPHSPLVSGFSNTQPIGGPPRSPHNQPHFQSPSPQIHGYLPSQDNTPPYDEQVLDEAPPSYDGPGVPNDGMDKNRPEASRPSDITTDLSLDAHGRPRQASIGILQHPQPASMAASTQRSSPDMGAESLRRQLHQQENLAQMERVQRHQEQRAVSERERIEREAARARARELERTANVGGQVGSLQSVGASPTTGGPLGWERRGSGSRPVFELPAVEDDEPRMAATSYPGQEWVPPMWDGAD